MLHSKHLYRGLPGAALAALISTACGGGGDHATVVEAPTTIEDEQALHLSSTRNSAPTATGGNRAVHAGASGSRTPWVDDADLWDQHTHQLATAPENGTASFNGGRWTYRPHPGFTSGNDSFTYLTTDRAGATVAGTAKVRVYDDAALAECTRNSSVKADGSLNARTKSNSCTYFGSRQTRMASTGAMVSMDYFVNRPSDDRPPKGVVVLIGGGDLNMNLTGDATTGMAATNGGGNFVIRTAQLIADAGYIAVAIDRPSDLPAASATDPIPAVDQYRISARHAVDIVSLLKHINTENLPVFMAGTSRGAMSVMANNLIAAGILVSSPVTNDGMSGHLYAGHPGTPSLQAAFVKRPVHVMWHQNDLCSLSTPAGSQALYSSLAATGIPASFSMANGGVRVTTASSTVTPDVCGAFDAHGFLGIETTAAGHMASWLDGRMAMLGSNTRPEAAFTTFSTRANALRQINLAALVRDARANRLAYAVPHATTTLGGSVRVNGSSLVYRPPANVTNKTDHFVYVVTDGQGGVGSGVITVKIGS
jgi:hypothetical protein